MLKEFLNKLKQKTCSHIYDMDALKITGDPKPEYPDLSKIPYDCMNAAINQYYKDRDEWLAKRISCKCLKCGVITYTDAGLNLKFIKKER